jgi:hypothetical protein
MHGKTTITTVTVSEVWGKSEGEVFQDILQAGRYIT